jgi:site-specific DNA-methyltransferase (adenine-specific)/site-specific DNA-methyltransferase (cytosine-N4-specific)
MQKMKFVRANCLKWMGKQPDDCVDLVFGSPPYAEKGERYGGDSKTWPTDKWTNWMLKITAEAVRLSKGYVVLVVNGAVRDGRYLPGCEGLIYKAHRQGIVCERPCIWHKNAPPNRRDWFGNDWEYVLAFKPEGVKPYFDWESVAQPPKYTAGGQFRQRDANGKRRRGSDYPQNKLARPRDVVRVTVGGGHMGYGKDDDKLASEGEAPFPVQLAEYFVKSCCPVGGTVLDPFIGAGTSAVVAQKHDRRCIGIDVRTSQIELTRRRLKLLKQTDD